MDKNAINNMITSVEQLIYIYDNIIASELISLKTNYIECPISPISIYDVNRVKVMLDHI